MKRRALQVNLEPRLADAVHRLAEQDRASVSAVLHESVERYVAQRQEEHDPLDDFIGILESDGPIWDATELDEELARDHEERYG